VPDIDASREGRSPRFPQLADLASECFMPLCYGGGPRSLEDIERAFGIGLEKVAINTHAELNRALAKQAARRFGSQSIAATIDVKTGFWARRRVVTHGSRQSHEFDPMAHAREMELRGAGKFS
jgi:cyclase